MPPKRTRDPLYELLLEDTRARFYSYVNQVPTERGCVEWSGFNRGGYGVFWLAGQSWLASQVAWMLKNAKIWPSGLWALHACDNPPCISSKPGHVYPGTPQDNVRDREAHGRGRHWTPPKGRYDGDKNPNAKLTDSDRVEICRLYYVEHLTQNEIASRYPINQPHVSRIVRDERYRMVLEGGTVNE
jgi:predicted DNA-binding protein (UPF0251 family)